MYQSRAREKAAEFATCCRGVGAANMLELLQRMRIKSVTKLIEEGVSVGMGYMRVVYQNAEPGVHSSQGVS